MNARFAAVRVRVADGPPQRIGDKGMQHMPGDEVWLVGERRASGEQKYYLANLSADAGLKTLAAAIKARWVCEQPLQTTHQCATVVLVHRFLESAHIGGIPSKWDGGYTAFR